MKILLATESYWPNHDGGAVFEHGLVLDLVKKGHEVRVIAPAPPVDKQPKIQEDRGSRIHRLRSVIFFANTSYRVSQWPFREVARVMDEFKPDVAHIHNTWLIGFATLFSARKRRIPVVATNHFMPENFFTIFKYPAIEEFFNRTAGRIIWKLLVWFHNKATVVTSPTQTAVDLLTAHGLRVPGHAISNGVDMARFAPAEHDEQKREHRAFFHLPQDVPIILYTGRLDPEKRLDILLNAAAQVLKNANTHFVLAGGGKDRARLERQVRELGIAQQVSFLGRVPDENWVKVYQLADVFAISSPAELQSMVTLEAIATGLPVVATRVAALPEIVHENENGFLFERNDYQGMAHALATLVQDAQMRARFGAESRNIATPHSTRETFSQFEELYKKVTTQTS